MEFDPKTCTKWEIVFRNGGPAPGSGDLSHEGRWYREFEEYFERKKGANNNERWKKVIFSDEKQRKVTILGKFLGFNCCGFSDGSFWFDIGEMGLMNVPIGMGVESINGIEICYKLRRIKISFIHEVYGGLPEWVDVITDFRHYVNINRKDQRFTIEEEE